MVGKTNLELESIINNALSSQRTMGNQMNETEKKMNSRFEAIETRLVEAEKKSDKRFADIMDAITALKPKQEKGKGIEQQALQSESKPPPDNSQSVYSQQGLFKNLLSSTSKENSFQFGQQNNKTTKPSNDPQASSAKRKFQTGCNPQQANQTLQNSSNIVSNEGAINLYRPTNEYSLDMTERERKIRKYFPDFFPQSEADNPNGPLREASNRNRVTFPHDSKLKYANSDTLEKLYRMQVMMIQSMLPYAAWPVRVALEMEEDFIAVRRNIHNHSLDWAGAVDCILTILFKHNVLGAPLTNLARLTVQKGESSLDFARRLRKAIYALPSDVVLTLQVREIQRNHIQQSLPRTWTIIQRDSSSMSNHELADYTVQITEGIECRALEDAVYHMSPNQRPIPLLTYDNLNSFKTNLTSTNQPLDINTLSPEGFTTSNAQIKTNEVNYPAVNSNNNQCFKCGREGHWANECKAKPNQFKSNNSQPSPKHNHSKFSKNLRDKFLAIKYKGSSNHNRLRLPTTTKSRDRVFTTEQSHDTDDRNTRSGVDQLEDDQIDSEIENFLQDCLKDESD